MIDNKMKAIDVCVNDVENRKSRWVEVKNKSGQIVRRQRRKRKLLLFMIQMLKRYTS